MARYRVLFIDDEPAILRSLGDYFEKLGHDVYRADTGKAGIAMFERAKPDVTVLDLKLPDISGLEVLGTIRRQHATVLMLTGYGEVETAVEAMRLGAEDERPNNRIQISRIDILVDYDKKLSQSRCECCRGVKCLPCLGRVRNLHLNDKESPPTTLFVDGYLLDAAQSNVFFQKVKKRRFGGDLLLFASLRRCMFR